MIILIIQYLYRSPVELEPLSITMETCVTSHLSGHLNKNISTQNSYSLLDAVSLALGSYQACLLTAAGFTVAVMQRKQSYFILTLIHVIIEGSHHQMELLYFCVLTAYNKSVKI